ncbi:M15 family metallopeptidase [Clostridium tyrobutyricum]|uniref:M15 family metallopeptidase n=1 Tax=Clostridium tyrobutyricum TaxID=1519 RepID=UPI0002D4E68C|nr:M15 family metallopeptidase [Clostridium tyrobutyricum]MBV4425017.1 M15 family metallopeptidase [Clostridium tyrobutyricum]MEA5008807.1 M15 family metallopeptidase [Clostridium tyrobutyricum]
MKKIILILLVIFILTNSVKAEESKDYTVKMKQDLLCIMMAYPEYVKNVIKDDNGYVYIIMKSGRKILYDDKREKSFDEKLFNTDIQDMMEQFYPLGSIDKVMDKDSDPGRFRVYPLLEEVYGGSRNEIEKNLVITNLVYRNLQFNKNNKASDCLENAIKELVSISKNSGNIATALFPYSGTYNYRNISGTNLKSPHSFAIAIDLARDRRDYWKWTTEKEGTRRIKSYPKEIVDVFEKNNFVWGGKWSHFDILHFEYRPEIVLKSKYYGSRKNSLNKWYDGAPYDNNIVKGYINRINNGLN